MRYSVTVKKKISKKLLKLPKNEQKLFFLLVEDLKEEGPRQNSWPNFSPLGKNKFHCHLSYRYVACWTHEKENITIEVYYVGSREKTPY